MMANMARLADDMAQSKKIVGSTMKDIEGAVDSAKKALAALGIGVGIGYFVSLIRGSIDAMDHLHDLNRTTNITVETLAGLKVAAKQSGADLDSIAQSINKLSVEMGKSPEKFRMLGISAKDPLKAFQQLSDVFIAIENPQQRAAVMAAALGKSWAGAAPLLAEGSQRISEMVAKGSQLSGVTTEMAQQADALNDKWVLLGGTGGMLTRMVGPMLPLLNLLADELLKTKDNASGANDSFSPLKDTLQVLAVLYANLAFMAKTAGNEIGGTAAQAARIAVLDFSGAAAIRQSMLEEAAKAKADLEAFEKKVMGAGLTGKAADDKPNVKPVSQGAIAGFLGGDDKHAEAVARALQAGLDEEIKVMGEAAQLSNDFQAAERAKEKAFYDERNRILIEAYDREQEEAIAHGAELIQIEQWQTENRKKIQAGFLDFLGNLAGLMNTHSRKVFEIGKIGAIGQAAYKGALAVMDAWEAGMSTGGPWAPIIAAGYAAAAGANALNLINNIRKQQFGGGGGFAASPGQGASGVTGVGIGSGSPQPSFAGNQPQGSQMVFNVNVTGVVTQSVIDQMIEQLKDQIDNHDVTIIGPNSRQAADLAAA